MIKKFLFFVLFTILSIAAIGQDNTIATDLPAGQAGKKKGRPNIPGTFAIDFGFNLPTEKEGFNTNFFGSRTLNIYYYYDHQIGGSNFSLHPGIGFGLERYKFSNDKTLGYIEGPNSPYDTLRMLPASSFVPLASSIKKTGLITNYIDVPLEVRFSSNPDDPGRSFKVSLGFKFGVLYDSFTKIKYREDSETKKLKDKQNFNLNPIRYGVLFRIGAGSFSAFANYTLSPLFKDGEGPDGAKINNFTVGLTLAAF
jgi:hypothetical protein